MGTESVDRLKPVPITGFRVFSIKEAAERHNKSPDTVVLWCKRYGIGRQMGPKTPWRVSAPALQMVVAADAEALEAFREADFGNPLVERYIAGLAE